MSISCADRPVRCSRVLQQWRDQIGREKRHRFARDPRPLAIMTCLASGRVVDGLVPLFRATFVVLHDTHCPGQGIRFAGYRAMEVPNGIRVGGADQMQFEKNLALSPSGRRDRPFRLREDKKDLLELALELDRILERHARYPHFPRPSQFRLPQFWAAVTTETVRGQGPEFESVCNETGRSPEAVLWASCRRHAGQTLYPLEFVSHAWRLFADVYVDLKTALRRQVIRLDQLTDLTGFSGACEFDFVSSRFRAH